VTADEAGAPKHFSGSQPDSQKTAVALATAEVSCPRLKSVMSLHLRRVYFTISICLKHKYARNGTSGLDFLLLILK
jgi:hypothetical protein